MAWFKIPLVKELAELIRAKIARMGPISFERLMEMALYHPTYGYYRRERGKPRTGRAGDFFTSVSVGPLFGRLLARQFLEMWELLEMPATFWIVEQGAEDAQLAGDILEWCRAEAPLFFASVRYRIIEDFSVLRKEQEQALAGAGLAGKAVWFRGMAELALEEPVGVFFSNELVDAFPVRRVVCRGGDWHECQVGLDEEENLMWTEREIQDGDLREAVKILPAIGGYTTEVNLRARTWMEEVGRALKRGYVATLDYGFPASEYYAPFRSGGTLTAYRDHRRMEDILADPGEQDITAHVDFSALARAGEKAGLATLGFLDQQHFLTGIAHDEMAGIPGPSVGVSENLRAWQTLTHPNHLGSRFHALLQGKDAPAPLAGLRYARSGALP